MTSWVFFEAHFVGIPRFFSVSLGEGDESLSLTTEGGQEGTRSGKRKVCAVYKKYGEERLFPHKSERVQQYAATFKQSASSKTRNKLQRECCSMH